VNDALTNIEPNKVVHQNNDRIDLECTHLLSNGKPCGKTTQHKIANILHQIRNNNNHILCQGPCDQKLKGKSSRKLRSEAEEELKSTRHGQYELLEYKRAHENCIVKHQCGLIISRRLSHITENNDNNGYSIEDCPACGLHLNHNIQNYSHWVHVVSDGCISLVNKVPAVNYGEFECQHDHTYHCDFEKILDQKYRGCDKCFVSAARKQRHYELDDVLKMVNDRGFEIIGSMPKSYSDLVDISGPINYSQISLLEFVRKYPAHSSGFGVISHAEKLSNGRYWVDENAFKKDYLEAHFFAGLLAADGWIETGKARIGILQHIKRESTLISLARFLDYKWNLNYHLPKGGAMVVEIKFTSSTIKQQLARWGIVENKSLILRPPTDLSDQQFLSFLAGYIEGDGSVRKRNTRRGTQYLCSLCSGSPHMINWFNEKITDIVGVNGSEYKNKSVYNLEFHLEDSKKIFSSLPDTAKLSTKLIKFIDLLMQESNG